MPVQGTEQEVLSGAGAEHAVHGSRYAGSRRGRSRIDRAYLCLPGGHGSRVKTVTVDQFVDQQQTDLEWIVPGVLPRPSILLLIGAPKEGKTFLAADIGRRIAAGEDVFGQTAIPSKVLYLTLDARETIWRNFFRKLRDSGVVFPENFLLVSPDFWHRPANVLSDATQVWTRELLAETKPAVVVLDVFREFHNGDENDSTSMKIVGDRVEQLFKDVALILVHHTKKIPDDVAEPNPKNYSRGSSYLTGKVDGFWLLHRGTLKMDTRFDEMRQLKGVRLPNGLWDFPDLAGEVLRRDHVLALCREHPDWSHNRLAQLALDRHGIRRSTYFRLLAGQACAHTDLTNVGDLCIMVIVVDDDAYDVEAHHGDDETETV